MLARLHKHAGIAIGAILFVVALLAILVAAIVAGTGGFGGSAGGGESHRTMGGAIVQQSAYLNVGFQRLITGGVNESQIVITPEYTNGVALRALYSPTGGGVVPAQPPRDAVIPGSDWVFVGDANMLDFGVNGANDLVALLRIRNDAICRAINSVVIGYNAPLAITLPVITSTTVANPVAGPDGVIDIANAFDTTSAASLSGVRQSCVQDSGGNFWYYQVLKAN